MLIIRPISCLWITGATEALRAQRMNLYIMAVGYHDGFGTIYLLRVCEY